MFDSRTNVGLGEQLADNLRLKIISGALTDGQKLTETAVAAEYGLSRAPVREAFRSLEYESLIELTRHGAIARTLTDKDLDEFYDVRFMLESFALTHILPEVKSEMVRFLAVTADRLELALRHRDAQEFIAQDIAFHSKPFEVTDHKFIKLFWANIDKLYRAILTVGTRRRFESGDFEYKRLVVDKHRNIVAAVKEGTTAGILAALREHFGYNSWIDKERF